MIGSEGRGCALYGALPGKQACRTLCAVIRTSSPRDAVPQRGTYWVKARTLCQGKSLPHPVERGGVGPHAMHDDRELARHGDDRATSMQHLISSNFLGLRSPLLRHLRSVKRLNSLCRIEELKKTIKSFYGIAYQRC